MVFSRLPNWWQRNKDEKEPRNRGERRARLYAKLRCPKCSTRYRWINADRHDNVCRGYVQRPKKNRKHEVVSPWPRNSG